MMALQVVSATDPLSITINGSIIALITIRSAKDEHAKDEWEMGGNKLWSPHTRIGCGTPQSVRKLDNLFVYSHFLPSTFCDVQLQRQKTFLS